MRRNNRREHDPPERARRDQAGTATSPPAVGRDDTAAADKEPRRVLIVDDERFLIDTLVAAIKPLYRVMVAGNGQQALKAARASPPPDLILLDIIMPDMDGYAVCRELKADEKTRSIPIIFITARNEEIDETLGFELGAVDYIAKPVSVPVVRARVKTHLALSRALKVQEQQNLDRRRWLADISHELRTPLAVLQAQVEALQDGIHTADAATLGVLHNEVMGLSRLVDDLYLLARADLGALPLTMTPLEPVTILEEVLESFAPRLMQAGIALETIVPGGKPWVTLGDTRRLRHLFTNLVENSARYTDRGGRLRVVVSATTDDLYLCFDDTPPTVPSDQLPRLFERFYRAESSRNRDHGGSGLGLAICAGIVAAHDGAIVASTSSLGGLRIEVALPRQVA
ncbi:MAG: response regulator [Magnetococcales bacterium]|nr:response regulator [Magnetococcales bacterium]